MSKKFEINGLYKVKPQEYNRTLNTLFSAFENYPKVNNLFVNKERRLAALKVTLSLYLWVYIENGNTYSLDNEINEAICLMLIKDENFWNNPNNLKNALKQEAYLTALNNLTEEEILLREEAFDEIEFLESEIKLPMPHIYVDFFGVHQLHQGKGHGSKIMKKVCEESDLTKIPLALFTNTKEDIDFYTKHGFEYFTTTKSKHNWFENTYMIRFPKNT